MVPAVRYDRRVVTFSRQGMASFAEALDFALSFPDMERCPDGPASRVMSLDCMRSLLERMGNPQEGRTTVHVTGSKGKGSTAHFIASVLSASGRKTTLYTSPHLHSYRERIAIDMRELPPAEFASGISAIKKLVETEHAGGLGPVSTFGVMTALYLYWTRESKADCQVVEVGLGGTFDGTNVFTRKDVAVITPISLEHTRILGASPAEIAASKAGIITPGCVAVLAPQKDRSVKEVIARRCSTVGADLVYVEEQYEFRDITRSAGGQSFILSGPQGCRRVDISMLGRHQIENAATAVAALDALVAGGIGIAAEAMRSGLGEVRIPGRVEVLSQAPLVVVDGAHNVESITALSTALRDSFSFRRCIGVLGVNQDKDLEGILGALRPLVDRLVCTRSKSLRAMPPDAVLSRAGSLAYNGYTTSSAAEAMELAVGLANSEDLVCVTGSLALVGEARALILRAHAKTGPTA